MSGLLNAYSSLLRRRPLMGNMLTSAVLFATGDVIAQQIVEKKGDKHDFARTGRIVVWGGGMFAPFVTVWFKTLERVPIKSKTPAALTKACLDQFIAAPAVLSTFFCVMTLMEGKTVEDAKKKWETSFAPTLKTNWSVWFPVQCVNMFFVPLTYRILFVNAVNIPWNTYLSLQASNATPGTEKAKVSDKSFGE